MKWLRFSLLGTAIAAALLEHALTKSWPSFIALYALTMFAALYYTEQLKPPESSP